VTCGSRVRRLADHLESERAVTDREHRRGHAATLGRAEQAGPGLGGFAVSVVEGDQLLGAVPLTAAVTGWRYAFLALAAGPMTALPALTALNRDMRPNGRRCHNRPGGGHRSQDDKPVTKLRTTVTRGDGTVALDGTAVCYTMAITAERH
jgi:hypothetical protein